VSRFSNPAETCRATAAFWSRVRLSPRRSAAAQRFSRACRAAAVSAGIPGLGSRLRKLHLLVLFFVNLRTCWKCWITCVNVGNDNKIIIASRPPAATQGFRDWGLPNFENEGFEAFKEQRTNRSTQAKTNKNMTRNEWETRVDN